MFLRRLLTKHNLSNKSERCAEGRRGLRQLGHHIGDTSFDRVSILRIFFEIVGEFVAPTREALPFQPKQ